jgi:hypothetical protein
MVGSGSGVSVEVSSGAGLVAGNVRDAVATVDSITVDSGVTLADGLAVPVICTRVGNKVEVAGMQAVNKTSRLPVRKKRRIISKL